MAAVKNFILVYNHAQQELQEIIHFEGDVVAATRKYSELESEHRGSTVMDIVLVGSDSLETVKVTHASYFTGEAQKRIDEMFRLLDVA